jgi:catechol 2,3-dioxygenase-like lactoylglutathione lyase family enzyme
MRTLHFGLRVADLDRSLAFYAAVGYEVVGSVPDTLQDGQRGVRLRRPAVTGSGIAAVARIGDLTQRLRISCELV